MKEIQGNATKIYVPCYKMCSRWRSKNGRNDGNGVFSLKNREQCLKCCTISKNTNVRKVWCLFQHTSYIFLIKETSKKECLQWYKKHQERITDFKTVDENIWWWTGLHSVMNKFYKKIISLTIAKIKDPTVTDICKSIKCT